ncbi:MAG: histidine phosphatase family protein [Rhodospirillaceae bacterium]|jgi:broad specificity phosphatase PhoE|nr:histidine phosphatase family protein [Rhodospirillaceae bacterium]MBT5455816.1 histidine phosphatase family protein [Rhodospirillaceae bacterium]
MAEDVYLIRHGQSTFNIHFEATGIDPLHFDAPLSALGMKQVAELRAQVAELNVDLVVTSPLTRALETAVGLFGGETVPIVVSSLHRERLGNSCDVGRAPEILSAAFPALNFDHLDDVWWHDGEKDDRGVPVEPDPIFLNRVTAFSRWVVSRPERTVAIVGHGTFIHRLTGRHLENCEIMEWAP